MALENANYIPELIDTNPPGTDFVLEGDNHVRMLKKVLQTQFPDVPAGPIANAGENPSEPDEALTEPDNIMLWSPKAIADFIKAYFDGWGLAVTTATTMRATVAAMGSIPKSTPTKIEWGTPDWDTATGWDAPNNQYTIPQAGIWRVNVLFFLNWSAAQKENSSFTVEILVNGVVERAATTVKGGEGYTEKQTCNPNGLFNLALDDTISARLTYEADNVEQVNTDDNYTSFEVHRVSDTPV